MFATSTIAQRIRYMIARQRQRQLRNHAVQTALAGALGYHPEFRDTGFDAHFIRHRAAKTIAPYIQHGDAPDVRGTYCCLGRPIHIWRGRSPRARSTTSPRW